MSSLNSLLTPVVHWKLVGLGLVMDFSIGLIVIVMLVNTFHALSRLRTKFGERSFFHSLVPQRPWNALLEDIRVISA